MRRKELPARRCQPRAYNTAMSRPLLLTAAVFMSVLMQGAGAAQTANPFKTVAVPRATAIPVRADSHPFGAADHTQTPIDLAKLGYEEEEFSVSGIGNVYDWSTDGSISPRQIGLLWATRILVRRPIDASRFSGTVLVDIANQGAGFDTFAVWGQLSDHLLANGHAYVAVTAFARNIGALRMFSSTRYRMLTFPQSPVDKCGAAPRDPWNRPAEFFPVREEGVRWDMISQVGALLKSRARPGNRRHPMGDLRVEYVFASMQSAGDLPTYINAVHKNVTLENGKPIFDGFIIKDSGAPRTLNACAPPLAADDPRRIIRNAGVPVISIVAQPEVSAAIRRPDSDVLGDEFRRYELPGASHFDLWHFKYFPSVADLAAAGVPPLSANWTFPKECTPDVPVNDFPQPYFFAGAFANLDRWVRTATPPPRAEPIMLGEGATAGAVTDEFGNARGGVRSPWVDVPGGTFHPVRKGPNSTPFTCADLGYWEPFTPQRLEAVHGSVENYRKKFLAATDVLARDRWVTPEDAEKIKATAP